MKKLLLALAVAATLYSCNKGDDNPYGNWKCTCFVTTMLYVHPEDTVRSARLDTVLLNANEMDKNSATAFCKNAQTSYVDTFGSNATCTLK
jgi:hypothetical protein